MNVSRKSCVKCGSKSVRVDGGVTRCMQCGRDQGGEEQRPRQWTGPQYQRPQRWGR
jgi:uncharacterized membrane protein YvbJ